MQRGFSLVEVLVAIALLASAMVALAQVVAMAETHGFVAATRTATTVLASQKIEELRVRPWSEIGVVGASPPEFFNRDGAQCCLGAVLACADAVYERHWSSAPATFGDGVLVITVEVTTTGQRPGRARLVTARSRRTR